MKKIIVFYILVATLVTGCGKEFLEPKQYVGGTADGFLVNEPSLDRMTVSVYKRLLSDGDFRAKGLYGCLMWVFADGAADLVNSRNQQWDENPIDIQIGVQNPNTSLLLKLWRNNYQAIRFANDVIDNAERVPDDQFTIMQRDNYVGEAKFIRALAYFNLIRIFGGRPHVASENQWGVPMVTKAITGIDGLLLPRGTVAQAYEQIISDLDAAEKALPTSWPSTLFNFQTKGRAVKGSAWGLLAKVYMTKAGTSNSTTDWTNAALWADKVLAAGSGFNLKTTGAGPFPNNPYYSLFRIDGGGENSIESLFEVQSVNDAPGQYGFGDSYNNFLASNSNFADNHKGNAHPTSAFINMYEANDLRREASVFVFGDKFFPDMGGNQPLKINGVDYIYRGQQAPLPSGQRSTSTGYNVKKFVSGKAIYNRWETGPANPRVLRYAEMLLIKAEAENEINGPAAAAQYVNRVRARAGLGALPTTLNNIDMRNAIWKERAIELFMEADRWFDLKRTDRLISAMFAQNQAFPTPNADNKFTTQKHYIMPIPQSEINASIENGQPLLIQAPEY